MTPVELVLSRLQNPVRQGQEWRARCPAHRDQRPSLSVREGNDKRALVHCFAGCPNERIVEKWCLTLRDLMPANTSSSGPTASAPGTTSYSNADKPIANLVAKHGLYSRSWTYHNSDESPVGLILRWDTPDGKDIRPVSLTKKGWIVGGMPTPRPPYRLPDLLARSSERVFVCEGEPAAEAARSIGLLVTTSAHGSNSFRETDWTILAGRDVVIFPDNDPAGLQYAEAVAKILLSLSPPATVRIVQLPRLPPKGDFVEFLEVRDSRESSEIVAEVETLVNAVAPMTEVKARTTDIADRQVVLVRMQDVQPKPIEWLWRGRLALGKLTLFMGDPDLGKSLVTLDMSARVSTGAGFPGSTDIVEPGGVVLLSAEDAIDDTIRPRLDAAGADVSHITAIQAVKQTDPVTGAAFENTFCLATDIELLEQAILATPNCKLCVIDPISAYLGSVDSHSNASVRGVLTPLARLAAKHKVAIVAVTHLRKGDGPALYRAMASLGFIAAARTAWVAARDPTDPTGARRVFVPVKNNLGQGGNGLGYSLSVTHSRNEHPIVLWDADPVTVTADEALAANRPTHVDGGAAESALDEAIEWLREFLSAGPQKTEDIQSAAREAGLAWGTLRRARTAIGARAKRVGFGADGVWYWHPPPSIGAQAQGADTASIP